MIHPPSALLASNARSSRALQGYTLIELLTVIAIIAIMTTAATSLVPPLFESNQLDKNMTTLSGILEQAREAAISRNTYVWVAFTSNPPSSSPASGVRTVLFESQDGTDVLSNFTNTGTSSSPLLIGSANGLAPLSPLQTLPGIQLSVPTGSLSKGGAFLQSGMNLTLNVGGIAQKFTQAVMFTPDGEARVAIWNSLVEVQVQSSLHPQSPNVAVLRLSRLTGRLTVSRP